MTIYIFQHKRTGGIIESTNRDFNKKLTDLIFIGEREIFVGVPVGLPAGERQA